MTLTTVERMADERMADIVSDSVNAWRTLMENSELTIRMSDGSTHTVRGVVFKENRHPNEDNPVFIVNTVVPAAMA